MQDADRLDALGALEIARWFTVGGQLKKPFYESADPFCEKRQPEDSVYTLDHFYIRLFQIASTMKTKTGQVEATLRLHAMEIFIDQLEA